MASFLPDGSAVRIASGLSAVKNITAISNANPAVCTSTAHGFTNGDVIVLSCGWGGLDQRVFKIAGVAANTFQLVGADTRDTQEFPAGQGANSGIGTCRAVNGFTQIQQIAEFTPEGGQMQYVPISYLDKKTDIQLPTTRSARLINIKIGDDPTMAGYKAAKAASDSNELMPLMVDMPNGQIYYNGRASLDEVPTLNKGQLMTVELSYAVVSEPVRY